MAETVIENACPICSGGNRLTMLHGFEGDSHYVAVCGACTVQTILPHPTTEDLKSFYISYHNTRTPEEQMPFLVETSVHLFKALHERWRVPQAFDGARYLEIGFGNGASLLGAALLGMSAFGMDLDPSNVSDVARRASSMGVRVQVECGDMNEVISRGEKFDFIKASQLIEHLVDPVQFVDSMFRLLLPGGSLFLECPNNAASFLRIKNVLRKKYDRLNFYNSLKLMEHLWGFNRTSMTRLLQGRGYELVFCTDYPVRHPYFQPENLLWYPDLRSGIRRTVSERRLYPLLKSAIPVFDRAASTTAGGGIGLATLARRPHGPGQPISGMQSH